MIMTDEIKEVLLSLLAGKPITEDDRVILEQLFYNEIEERDYVRKKLFPRCAA